MHDAINETGVNHRLFGQRLAGRAFGRAAPELGLVRLPYRRHRDGVDDLDAFGCGGALGDVVGGPRTQLVLVGAGAGARR